MAAVGDKVISQWSNVRLPLNVRLSLQLLTVDDLGAEVTTGKADVSFGRVLTLNVLNRVWDVQT